MKPSLTLAIFSFSAAEVAWFNGLNKQLRTKLSGKMATSLRVEAKISPLGVARCSFGMTKLRASRLDWADFGLNSGDFISVNRP